MSNYYLCATCRHCVVEWDGMGVWKYCRARNRVGVCLIMHDGIERPEDICWRYERKEADDGE